MLYKQSSVLFSFGYTIQMISFTIVLSSLLSSVLWLHDSVVISVVFSSMAFVINSSASYWALSHNYVCNHYVCSHLFACSVWRNHFYQALLCWTLFLLCQFWFASEQFRPNNTQRAQLGVATNNRGKELILWTELAETVQLVNITEQWVNISDK